MMRRTIAASVVGVSIALALAGCSASDLEVRYDGPFSLQVSACVVLGASGSLRDDAGVPSRIWIDGVTAMQSELDIGYEYTVDAVTHVVDGSGEHLYRWSCSLIVDGVGGSLAAELVSFESE